jgi:hypothetical protein
LAIRAHTEKLELVGNTLETAFRGDPLLKIRGEAFVQFNDLGAAGADKMMMVVVTVFFDQFESSCAITEIELLDHAQVGKQMHRAVNSCQIAPALRHSCQDSFDCRRVWLLPQDFEDSLARPSYLAALATQTLGQRGHMFAPGSWAALATVPAGAHSGAQMKI